MADQEQKPSKRLAKKYKRGVRELLQKKGNKNRMNKAAAAVH